MRFYGWLNVLICLFQSRNVFFWRVLYQLEGRYPDMLPMAPDIETARNELRQAQEMFEWPIQQL